MKIEELLEEFEAMKKIPELNFRNVIEKEPLDQLRERRFRIEAFLRETKDHPLAHQKIVTLSTLLLQEIAKRETEQFEQQRKNMVDWVKREVPKHLPHLRLITDCALVHRLLHGMSTPESIANAWITPTSTTVECTLIQEKRKVKIDLLKLISPPHWKQILSSPLETFYFPVQPPSQTATRKGKFVGIWRLGKTLADDLETKPIFFRSYLAIRRV